MGNSNASRNGSLNQSSLPRFQELDDSDRYESNPGCKHDDKHPKLGKQASTCIHVDGDREKVEEHIRDGES
jgi:hypothetical protein